VTRPIYVGPWRVDLTVRDGVETLVAGAVLARAIAGALDAAQAPGPASIGLILSTDAELAELNAAHLGKTGPTDVLSFPLLTTEAFPEPPGRRPHLGDIVVSVERAVEQATTGRGGQTGDVRWAPSDELRLLVTHGALHICGWDHAEPAEEAAMRAMEQRLLQAAPARSGAWGSASPSIAASIHATRSKP
jgi:probable rRNA maturation factor